MKIQSGNKVCSICPLPQKHTPDSPLEALGCPICHGFAQPSQICIPLLLCLFHIHSSSSMFCHLRQLAALAQIRAFITLAQAQAY